jgi:putative endonuclease
LNSKNKNTGNKGEAIATEWLVEKEYIILYNNWRYKQTEVDIIATKNNCLHFIEVKTRTNTKFGLPEESITTAKMNALKRAASAYIEQFPQWKNLQFDVVAITLKNDVATEIFFIEDVYF